MNLTLTQSSFPELCPITAAVEQLARTDDVKTRGAIFTRPEVVDFMLDLAGYTANRPLHELRILEPSFGGGSFLLPVVQRLLQAWIAAGDARPPPESLGKCVRAVELHKSTFTSTRARVIEALHGAGLATDVADALLDQWLIHGDFLLTHLPDPFDVVVGNPPYVRQELIPQALLAEYRSRFPTIYDRADLYVPFIERSLRVLTRGGVLSFICADRWTKNRYGGPLRKFVADGYHLKYHIDMTGVRAFSSDVVAYPAITVIARQDCDVTRVSSRPAVDAKVLTGLAAALTTATTTTADRVYELKGVVLGDAPWLLDPSPQLALLRRLESKYPLLEDSGCKVGIGVATGADSAFVGRMEDLPVEADRKEPLAMTKDLVGGTVQWRGFGVVNPFLPNGALVNLNEYPLLKSYLEARRESIAGRHCARKSPDNWYRTIDRITPSLTKKPKLLIPDIKGEAHVVYEQGHLYPHHNLYFITSDEWDLHALQAVLLSDVARFFVATYSTRMRGGFLRFQAQYLRRIRIPRWEETPDHLRTQLTRVGKSLDLKGCNRAVSELYELSIEDRELMTASQGQR